MAKRRPTYAGPLLLHPHPHLCPPFPAASLRRRLLDAMSCGASRRRPAPAVSPARHPNPAGRRRLSDLLKNPENHHSNVPATAAAAGSHQARRKMEALEELRGVMRGLQFGDAEKKKKAAMAVRKLAKADAGARETLAMLGAIPTLVGMLDTAGDLNFHTNILYALLNLEIGNDLNKAAIVKAGAVHKMLKLIPYLNQPLATSADVVEAIAANFLALTALDSNKSVVGTSGAIPFLVSIIVDVTLTKQARQDAMKAVFNLSISTSNIPAVVDTDLLGFLVSSIGDMDVTELALSIVGNVVSTQEGRKAVAGAHPEVFAVLVDVLSWSDSPACQEKASYVLMVMAHKAWSVDRQAMVDAGIVSAALELTLIGSTLAQKRASRILECLRVDKGKQVCGSVAAVSAPQHCSSSSTGVGEEMKREGMGAMSEERWAVKELVQQSLESNLRRIVKRANLPPDFAPSDHFKSLTATASSKSLPL